MSIGCVRDCSVNPSLPYLEGKGRLKRKARPFCLSPSPLQMERGRAEAEEERPNEYIKI